MAEISTVGIDKLEVFALDEKMNRVTLPIDYASLEWHRCYYECGDFTIEVPSYLYEPTWAYIYTDQRNETGIIERVEYTDEGHEGYADTVTLKGRFLESIMNDRTFLEETPEETTVRYTIKIPSSRFVTKEEVYTDGTNYYYSNSGGTGLVGTDGSSVSNVKTDSDGRKYVEGESGKVYVESQDYGVARNAYFDYDKDGNIVKSQYKYNGGSPKMEETEITETLFTDSKGNTYYKNESGGISVASSSMFVDRNSSTYSYIKRGYIGDQVVEKTVYVKGPWQITEATDPITEMDNVARCVEWARQMFQNDIIFEETEITGESKILNPSFSLLGDLLYSELKTVGASFSVIYDFSANSAVFRVWRGKNRTQSQSKNPWAVFSDTWGTMTNYTAVKDESNYKNTCYVLYEYDLPEFDSDGKPKLKEIVAFTDSGIPYGTAGWQVVYSTKRGFVTARIEDGERDSETYLDMRSEKPSCDSEWSRETYDGSEKPDLPVMKPIYDAYEESIMTNGINKLKTEYAKEASLDTGTIDTSGYLRDFDLGDMVEMAANEIGMVKTARITEVSEVWDKNGVSIGISIGEETLKEYDV